MRVAIHLQALKEIFSGLCDPVTGSAVLSSKIALTPDILSKYHTELGANTQYQAWFSSTTTSQRITLHMPQLAPQKVQVADVATEGYGAASYFAGSNLVADQTKLAVAAANALLGIGINIISPKLRMQGAIHGDNPIYSIATQAGGTIGFDIFDRFVLPEDSIVVYDKYINTNSIDLLKHLASKLSSGSKIAIFHSDRTGPNLLLSNDIAAQVRAANSKISVSCKTCTKAFASLEHDRYIFLGNRIQIVFTVGLDCLGPYNVASGERTNRRSKILFYDVTAGDLLDIQAADGSISTVKHYSGHTIFF